VLVEILVVVVERDYVDHVFHRPSFPHLPHIRWLLTVEVAERPPSKYSSTLFMVLQ
jgi:hypothetical protein